jgi:hypothetical protein
MARLNDCRIISILHLLALRGISGGFSFSFNISGPAEAVLSWHEPCNDFLRPCILTVWCPIFPALHVFSESSLATP